MHGGSFAPCSVADLVEVDDSGTVWLEFRPTDVVRWDTLSLDIGALETGQDLIDAATGVAEEALDTAGGVRWWPAWP